MTIQDDQPESNSSVRELVASAAGEEHRFFSSLTEARSDKEAVAILEGDSGGQIYVVAQVHTVQCDESALKQLLLDLDAIEWSAPEDAAIHYEAIPVGAGVPGGMGGGLVTESLWVHPRLAAYRAAIQAVLSGQRSRVAQ